MRATSPQCIGLFTLAVALSITESTALTCTTFSVDAGRKVYRARRFEGALELGATIVNPDLNDPVVQYTWLGATINQSSTNPTVTVPAGDPNIAVYELVTLTATAQSGCTVQDTVFVNLLSDGQLENFLLQLRGQAEHDTLMSWKSSADLNERLLYIQALRTLEQLHVASLGDGYPVSLETIGALNLPHGTNGDFASAALNGYTYYFMAGGEASRWFRVLRASGTDPAELVVDRGFGRKQYAFGVALSGDRAYVAGSEGLDVIDVADPHNPVHLGRWQPSSTSVPGQKARPYLNSVAVHQTDPTLVYVSAQALSGEDPNNMNAIDGVYVIDVSNPASPSPLGRLAYASTCAPEQYASGSWGGLRHRGSDLVFIEGGENADSLFIANGKSGLDQLVLSSDGRSLAASAAYQAGCPATGSADELLAQGTSVWVGGRSPVIARYDLTSPPPAYSSTPITPAPSLTVVTSLASDGSHLFLGGYSNPPGVSRQPLVETRAMDPAAFTLLSTRNLPYAIWASFPATLEYSGGRLLVEDDWHVGTTYTHLVDATGNVSAPVGTLHLSGEARAFALLGVNAFAGVGGFVAALDISAPAAPSIRSWLDLGGFGPADLQAAGAYVYVLQPTTTRILIIDGSDPQAPFVRANTLGAPVAGQGLRSMCVSGASLLAHWQGGSGAGTLAVYDIAGGNGAAPVPVRSIGLDLNDPVNGLILSPGSARTMACDGQYAYIRGSRPPASDPPLLKILAVNYQSAPYAKYSQSFDIAQDAIQMTIAKHDQYLLIHNGLTKNFLPDEIYRRKASGLARINISNPASMFLAGQLYSYAWSASGISGIPGTNLVMTNAYDMDRGVRVFNFEDYVPTLFLGEDADLLHAVDDIYSAAGWSPGMVVNSKLYSLKLDHLEIFDFPY